MKEIVSEDGSTMLQWQDFSELEKRQVPEFFKGGPRKTPERYLEIRNLILRLWEESKPYYLKKSVPCQNIRADVNSVGRVHSFLEKYGFINVNSISASTSTVSKGKNLPKKHNARKDSRHQSKKSSTKKLSEKSQIGVVAVISKVNNKTGTKAQERQKFFRLDDHAPRETVDIDQAVLYGGGDVHLMDPEENVHMQQIGDSSAKTNPAKERGKNMQFRGNSFFLRSKVGNISDRSKQKYAYNFLPEAQKLNCAGKVLDMMTKTFKYCPQPSERETLEEFLLKSHSARC
uniref:SWIRM domain-containing protein n=1 Tax=Palpitomonas bilix TaxID=652834 RepID=A0A7S3G912_9EUKA|mmetsp:Transcript_36168/g.94076  ORF Transcript_36168/g.94076 Transcript_36168/m.94076 type:complete len:288 (+) Transcript_36168:72-935(+)|eukprot:CAMPEP_0113874272 /NCGR_PEP_ID=MMETSP0780_2-20120614/4237_1 /TAXON_ID=652834 /ORGANISM="Palpitomonas bilix" /LENGTH=287 /DNA_ID=CAMNT_0000860017 /DNA_START=30 /DNA_END=893 /DNA_ORIENTATION=+ /assembly_acc=CAM_ASM_000599